MKAIAEVYTECQLDKAERFLKKLVTGLAPRSETTRAQGFTERVAPETAALCCTTSVSLVIISAKDQFASCEIMQDVLMFKGQNRTLSKSIIHIFAELQYFIKTSRANNPTASASITDFY